MNKRERNPRLDTGMDSAVPVNKKGRKS
jgi:hypothetical protein